MVETIRLIDDLYKGFTKCAVCLFIFYWILRGQCRRAIHSVNVGLQSMLSALRQDPYALESVHLKYYYL